MKCLTRVKSNLNYYRKTIEENAPRFDKALEDFYSLCNQVELYLVRPVIFLFFSLIFVCFPKRTTLECTIQSRDSRSYLPFNVSKELPPDVNQMQQRQDAVTYQQYLNIIRQQVTYAKSIYEILSDSVRQIKDSDHSTPGPSQQQMAPHPPAGPQLIPPPTGQQMIAHAQMNVQQPHQQMQQHPMQQ